jgi:hypothetical protein
MSEKQNFHLLQRGKFAFARCAAPSAFDIFVKVRVALQLPDFIRSIVSTYASGVLHDNVSPRP